MAEVARTSGWLWCPAYPLADGAALRRARDDATLLGHAAGISIVASPMLDRHPGAGAWLPSDQRWADLQAGCQHHWLIAARGGYGCVDLLDGLDRPLPRIVGYSDLTVLHAAQRTLGGPAGIYGLMPGVPHGQRALSSTAALMRGEGWSCAGSLGNAKLTPATVTAPLFAGCLRVLAGLVGTRWMPAFAGCLLALEDIDERPYRLDRDLFQLQASGALQHLRGLILGRCPAALPTDYRGPTLADIAQRWSQRLSVPVAWGVPFGHDDDPLALAQDRCTTLTVSDTGWQLQQHPLNATTP